MNDLDVMLEPAEKVIVELRARDRMSTYRRACARGDIRAHLLSILAWAMIPTVAARWGKVLASYGLVVVRYPACDKFAAGRCKAYAVRRAVKGDTYEPA
jgi:hypothetical protein